MTTNVYQPFLRALGLSDAESTLYLGLLEGGPASIRQLAATTGVNRGKAYDSLKHLVSLGLVSFKRRGARAHFVAENPERVRDLIADKQHELEQLEATAGSVLPSLLALGKRRSGEPIVRFYEDDEGITAILRDVLSTVANCEPKEYRVYSSQLLRQYLYRRFPNFTRRRIAAQLVVKVIAIGHPGDPAEYSERRQVPSPTTEQTSSYVLIYGDKVAMVSLSPNNTPYGVVIEEPGVAATQRLLFDTLWHQLPESTENSHLGTLPAV